MNVEQIVEEDKYEIKPRVEETWKLKIKADRRKCGSVFERYKLFSWN